jgi:DSF synthase
MLKELHEVQMRIVEYFRYSNMQPKTPIKFFVYASQIPEIYNFGGNLEMLVEVIKKQDRPKLEKCAKSVIDAIHFNSTHMGIPIYSLTLVEGKAFGGGFEMALSFDALIAEEQSEFGLQQARFGIFSGMGYGSLVRKVGMKNADTIVTSTKTYNVHEMQDMGAVDIIADRDSGKKVIDKFMNEYRRSFDVQQALHAARLRYAPHNYAELEYMAKLWIDSILNMNTQHFNMLKKLADGQAKSNTSIEKRLRTKQDRRFMDTIEFPFTDADGIRIEKDRRDSPDPREQS